VDWSGGFWERRCKDGRVRTCALQKKPFAAVESWLAEQRALWEGRTDRLELFVTTLQKKEKPE
jgi:hypothetical protein